MRASEKAISHARHLYWVFRGGEVKREIAAGGHVGPRVEELAAATE